MVMVKKAMNDLRRRHFFKGTAAMLLGQPFLHIFNMGAGQSGEDSGASAKRVAGQRSVRQPSKLRVSSQSITLEWDEKGNLVEIQLCGVPFPQRRSSKYLFNGQQVSARQAECTGTDQVVHAAQGQEGTLQLVWTGGARVTAALHGRSFSGVVKEAGFSLCLPPADIHTITGTTWRWRELAESHRVSFDDYGKPLTIGQFFLLELENHRWLRIGRQVKERIDYTTGYLEKMIDGWEFTWKWEPQAPFPPEYRSQPLEFEVFESLEAAVAEHRLWMEKTFRLVPKEENPKTPAWFKKAKLLVQVNIGETCGAVVHDYKDVTNLIRDLHSRGVPPETIIYIPDYNFLSLALKGYHGPICALWPENPLLGGKDAFVEMVRAAKQHGYHILAHASIVLLFEWARKLFANREGMAETWVNPEWVAMKQWAIRDRAGAPLGWPPTEQEVPGVKQWSNRYPYMVRYLNQAYPEVQRFFIEGISRLVTEYGIDAFHLDSTCSTVCRMSVWNTPFEDGRRAAGERAIIEQLYERHPHILLWAEGLAEESADLVPFMMWRSPISHLLMSRYVYTSAHTSTPGSIRQRYAEIGGIGGYQETAHAEEVELTRRQPNNIPRLVVNYRDYGLDQRTMQFIEELLAAKG
jgi:hypothetical protein